MKRIVAVGVVIALALIGCEEMVTDDEQKTRGARCDVVADWFIGKPLVIDAGGHMNPPQISDPSRDDGFRTDWSQLEAIRSKHHGRTFTLSLFRQIQQELYATGLYQEDDQKWGIETVAYPSVPRDSRRTNPTIGARERGCLGVELQMDGKRYLPQEIQERPLRLVE